MGLNFNLCVPEKINFGWDVSESVGFEAISLGGRKALVITDQGIVKQGIHLKILDSLTKAGLEAIVYDDVKSNPREVDCQEAAILGKKHGADIILALGGGSPIDTAKAVGVLIANNGSLNDYYGEQLLQNDIPPLICIPTTAGTGSEVTFFAVITNPDKKVKSCIADTRLLPSLSLIDPALTITLPANLTASTGMDALTHAIEAYTCRRANPFTDVLALQAITVISENLKIAVKDGLNKEAREGMALGSLLAGIAFGNSDIAGVHCMAEALGGLYDTPHGIANSIFLPIVLEYNLKANIKRHADIGRAMHLVSVDQSDQEIAEAVIEEIKHLAKEIGIPSFKDSIEVDPGDFKILASKAAANISADSNCRIAGINEYHKLFEQAYCQ